MELKMKLKLSACFKAIGKQNFGVLDCTIYGYNFCCYEALACCFSEHFKYITAMKTFFFNC